LLSVKNHSTLGTAYLLHYNPAHTVAHKDNWPPSQLFSSALLLNTSSEYKETNLPPTCLVHDTTSPTKFSQTSQYLLFLSRRTLRQGIHTRISSHRGTHLVGNLAARMHHSSKSKSSLNPLLFHALLRCRRDMCFRFLGRRLGAMWD
jgi:hypothetical protein